MTVIAAILAGGQASRLGGIAKGLLADAAGNSWIKRLIDQLALAGIDEVVISANDPAPYAGFGKTIVADLHPNVGPLGGIEAVLENLAGRCDAVLFTPCDLPNLSATEIRALVEAYQHTHSISGTNQVVTAETTEGEHPLCAIVPTALRADVSAAVASRCYGVGRLWKTLGAMAVRIEHSECLMNINTHEDLCHWRQKSAGTPAAAKKV